MILGTMPSLFDPIRLGGFTARNRVFMAPMTRGRATREHTPIALMAEHYRQRSTAGLIIAEATGVSRQGLGWPFAPGIWSRTQVEAWKPVTAAVHGAGGRIYSQLWHMGRVVHPSFVNGEAPVSASASTAPGLAHTYRGRLPHAEARALGAVEVPGIIDQFRHAALSAIEAGFDGVQIHGANGYLIDQFLRDHANRRVDAYGGPVENRIRLLREVTIAVADAVGADRTAVRLSPNGASQGVNDSDPTRLYAAAATELSEARIAFVELREPRVGSTHAQPDHPPIAPVIRAAFTGVLVLNSDYAGQSGQAALDAGEADAISFGRTFLSNPDLPHRIANQLALNEGDRATWYSQGPNGYTDYPTSVPPADRTGI